MGSQLLKLPAVPKCREQLLSTRRKLCLDWLHRSLAVTEGLLHSHLLLQPWQRRAVLAAGWHASAISPEHPPTASLWAISSAPKSVSVLAPWQTVLSAPAFWVRILLTSFLTSPEAASPSSPWITCPGLLC